MSLPSPEPSTQPLPLPVEMHPESANEVALGNRNSVVLDVQIDGSHLDVLWVDWEGSDDPLNPRNWEHHTKWTTTVMVSLFTLLTPISSSIIAPSTPQVAQEFGITNPMVEAMMTSVFVLGFAFGPLIFGPLSEIYGRTRVLHLSNLFFLAWNLGCAFAQNTGQLIAFRFLAGIGGSAPLAVGGGVIGDMWQPEERGRAITIYCLAPLLGPVIGPVCSGWIAQRSTWRWVFWSTGIVGAVIQVAGLIYLKETYAPYLLEKKAKDIMLKMDQEKGPVRRVWTVFETQGGRQWQDIFKIALTRPCVIFACEPIIQLLGLYMALVYGSFYLFLTAIPDIFRITYGMPAGIAELNYISLGIGLSLASQLDARYMDKIYVWLKEHRGRGIGEPEFRLPSMLPGAVSLPIGLLLTGWGAQARLHWIVPDIGIAFVGAGVILNYQSKQTYVVDAFPLHTASALAAVSSLEAVSGFCFPLFAPALYAKLGYGKGNTLLACVAVLLGGVGPCLFWFYGKKLRMRSRHAGNSRSSSYSSYTKDSKICGAGSVRN